MISRMLLGAGIGLFNSLSISLMSDFFESDEKATMIGMRTAFLNIGKALTTFLSGYLLLFGERAVFFNLSNCDSDFPIILSICSKYFSRTTY